MSRKHKSNTTDSLATPGMMRKIWMFINGLPGLKKYSLRVIPGLYPGVWCFYVDDRNTIGLINSVLHPTMRAAFYINKESMYIREGIYGDFPIDQLPMRVTI